MLIVWATTESSMTENEQQVVRSDRPEFAKKRKHPQRKRNRNVTVQKRDCERPTFEDDQGATEGGFTGPGRRAVLVWDDDSEVKMRPEENWRRDASAAGVRPD